jgi:hypothetical protein
MSLGGCGRRLADQLSGASALASVAPNAPPAERNVAIRNACGNVVIWDDAFQALVLAEYVQQPPDSPWKKVLKDAIDARDAVRICRGEQVETL